jgi:hypothetical protein
LIARSPASEDFLDRRSNRLARGLQRLGVSQGCAAYVFVDDLDGDDGSVAVRALAKLGVETTSLMVPQDAGAVAAAVTVANARPALVLASDRGVRALRAAGARCLIVGDGDGEGVRWWRAIELRESEDALPARCDRPEERTRLPSREAV